MSKRLIIFLALITLIVFPIPTIFVLYYVEDFTLRQIFQTDHFSLFNTTLGLSYGIAYAFLAILILRSPVFDSLPLQMEKVVRSMNLKIYEALFISFCAGFGEELLFRSGIQYYLGIWITSIFFVAIHGYLSIRNPKNSLYGLIVLPFILILAYGYEEFGLWFAISAHFAYDAVLFIEILSKKKPANFE